MDSQQYSHKGLTFEQRSNKDGVQLLQVTNLWPKPAGVLARGRNRSEEQVQKEIGFFTGIYRVLIELGAKKTERGFRLETLLGPAEVFINGRKVSMAFENKEKAAELLGLRIDFRSFDARWTWKPCNLPTEESTYKIFKTRLKIVLEENLEPKTRTWCPSRWTLVKRTSQRIQKGDVVRNPVYDGDTRRNREIAEELDEALAERGLRIDHTDSLFGYVEPIHESD